MLCYSATDSVGTLLVPHLPREASATARMKLTHSAQRFVVGDGDGPTVLQLC